MFHCIPISYSFIVFFLSRNFNNLLIRQVCLVNKVKTVFDREASVGLKRRQLAASKQCNSANGYTKILGPVLA